MVEKLKQYFIKRRWLSGVIRQPSNKAYVLSDAALKVGDVISYSNGYTCHKVIGLDDYLLIIQTEVADTFIPVEYFPLEKNLY